MPKHTYTELVAAGAPELPFQHYYEVSRLIDPDLPDYQVIIYNNDLYKASSLPFGHLSMEKVVIACAQAHRYMLADIKKRRGESEWLGRY